MFGSGVGIVWGGVFGEGFVFEVGIWFLVGKLVWRGGGGDGVEEWGMGEMLVYGGWGLGVGVENKEYLWGMVGGGV